MAHPPAQRQPEGWLMLARSVLTITLLAGPAFAAAPPTAQPRLPEGVRKFIDILTNPNTMAVAEDLCVSKSRLGWEWLARKHGIRPGGSISRRAFKGPPELFRIIDRDGDGYIRADDFDWRDSAPFVRQQMMATAMFRRLNRSGDGQMTEKEWKEAFERIAGGKEHITPEDLRRALFAPSGGPPMKPPTRLTRLMGLFTGELGSVNEGARLGELAPDFELSTPDLKQTIKLSSFKGKKPVVLIFGNFT
jgi:hypothetical protein